MEDKILEEAFDLHIHSYPDTAPRKTDDIELARAAANAGMAGIMIKSHHGSTVERAYLVRQIISDVKIYGGVVLNYTIGGINPHAVDDYVRMGAKQIWMPTLSSDYMISYQKKNVSREDRIKFNIAHGGDSAPSGLDVDPGDPWPWSQNGHGISILNEKKKLKKDVLNILEILSKKDVILGTGHISVEETFALVKAAREMQVERILINHPEYMPAINIEDQILLSKMGVFFERCFVFTTQVTESIGGFKTINIIVENIRKIGVETTILCTDFGQSKNVHPVQAMKTYLLELMNSGFSEKEIDIMAKRNPSHLIGD